MLSLDLPTQAKSSTKDAVARKLAVWILEDDQGCNFIYEELLQHKYNFRIFKSIREFREEFFCPNAQRPELIIADLRLPDGSFVSLYHEIPAEIRKNLAILIVSVCDDLDIIRYCLAEGVKDYLTKPFNRSELIVKIERAMRRKATASKLTIDPLRRLVSRGSDSISLTSKELLIVNLLAKSADCSLTRAALIASVWPDEAVGNKTLDVHIFNLRRKLAQLKLVIRYLPPQTYQLESAH